MNNSRSAALNAAEFLDTFLDGLTFGKNTDGKVHVSRVQTSVSEVRATASALLLHKLTSRDLLWLLIPRLLTEHWTLCG